MESGQKINITEQSTIYEVTSNYHSELACQNYDAEIEAVEENDGRITFRTNSNSFFDDGKAFVFCHSDPDRIIALAEMMKAFAQMVKKNNNKPIDTDANA